MTKRKSPDQFSLKHPNRHPDRVEEFRTLYNDGLTDREIARRANVHHHTIASFRRNHDLPPNGTVRQKLELVGDDKAKCSKCGDIKTLAEFAPPLSYCLSCRRTQINNSTCRDYESYIRDRWTRLKNRAAKSGIECSITADDIIAQFLVQNGLCFYTDAALLLTLGSGVSPNSFSIDRIDPASGYVRRNVVIAAYRINAIKSNVSLSELKLWMPGWYERAQKFISSHGGSQCKL